MHIIAAILLAATPADPPGAPVYKASAIGAADLASLLGDGGAAAHDFDIDWSTLDSGGGVSAVEEFELHGTIGQFDTAALAVDDFVLTGGFWAAEGGPLPPCVPDCDGDAALTIDDFVCFQTLFAIADPAADCEHDGDLDIDDFICFQVAFAVGCG